jgi:hypothetical protein
VIREDKRITAEIEGFAKARAGEIFNEYDTLQTLKRK